MSRKPMLLAAEGVNKSFSGFQGDQGPQLLHGGRRAAHGHRSEWRGEDDLSRPHHRPNEARDSGSITWQDETELTHLSEYEIFRLGIGRKFQTPTVYSDHTVFENLVLSLEGTRSVWLACFTNSADSSASAFSKYSA
jgi:urea transport system ATP-binding protein